MLPSEQRPAMVPVPDPTVLTTDQLLREVKSLKEILETRLNGMDTAIELLQHTSDRFPTRIDEKIVALKEVHEEKFRSIATQFAERDTRTDQTSRDSKVAVDAALQAAKEAVGEQNRSSALAIAKSEAATQKQIDQQSLLIQGTAKASDEKIDDIKERLTRIEGKGEGVSADAASRQTEIRSRQSGASNNIALIGMIVGALIAIAGIIIAVILKRT